MGIKHVKFDDSATIAFGSITGTYADLLALTDDIDILFIFNTTDTAIVLRIPSGLTKAGVLEYANIRIPQGASKAIDCRTNSKRIAKGTIQVKFASVAATAGEVTITAAR